MRILIILVLILSNFIAFSQETDEHKLAIQYYNNQEFDKAELYLKKLYSSNPKNYYKYYKKTLSVLKKQEEVQNLIKSQIKFEPKNIAYQYDMALWYKEKEDELAYNKMVLELINKNCKNSENINELYQLLEVQRDHRNIVELIYAARKALNVPQLLEDRLVVAYITLKDYTKASDLLIKNIDATEKEFFNIINHIQVFLENKEFLKVIEKQIYTQLAKNPNSDKWNEVAIWLSLQLKDYDEAMTLVKAIDKRNQENGNRVFSIANIAMQESQYETAIKGFDYITSKSNSPFQKAAFENKLKSMVESYGFLKHKDSVYLNQISTEFGLFFNKYSLESVTASTQILYANFLVKYVKNIDSTILLLKDLIKKPNVPKEYKSTAKLTLADNLLVVGEIWEAALLYGQVDKDEKDSPLGEEARFKNSRLFYYNGEFELAEELLSILKTSTTELIANDALYLAVFIQENKDGDSLELGMKKIAQSELLFYQNKETEALKLLREVKSSNKNSTLLDDIAMIESQLMIKNQEFILAEKELLVFKDKYKSSILADKAIFSLAKIQEENMSKSEDAKENYLLILTQYKDSVYTAEARKRLRKLRGEVLEEDTL